MKSRSMTCAALCLVALCGLGAIPAPGLSGPIAAAQPPKEDVGPVSVRAFHSVTREPLSGMPVFARAVPVEPEGVPMQFQTGEDGSVVLMLPRGVWDVYIEFNNHVSNVERVTVNPDTDFTPQVELSFNPDIDPG